MTEAMKRFAHALEGVETVLVTTHVNPDGDAIGSALAVRAILEQAGKNAEIVMTDEIPLKYRFLIDHRVHQTGAGTLEEAAGEHGFDMVVFVDASERERVGAVLDSLDRWCRPDRVEVNLDHHISNDLFGDIAIVDPHRASAAEIVYDLACFLGIEMTPKIAAQLYAGILTDTGRFQYANTTVACLRTASALVAAGADPAAIAETIYLQRPLPFYRLLGRLLAGLELHHDGRTCLMTMPSETVADLFPDGGLDTEGIVDFTVRIEGVEVGAFIRQIETDVFRASLRSRGTVNVRTIAEVLGGGGHENASGCSLPGPLETARSKLLDAIGRELP